MSRRQDCVPPARVRRLAAAADDSARIWPRIRQWVPGTASRHRKEP